MPNELKKKTIRFVVIIYLLSIISTVITKNAIITIDIIVSVSLLSFIYIKYYPIGNVKKELLANKIALTMGMLYIIVLFVSFSITYYFL